MGRVLLGIMREINKIIVHCTAADYPHSSIEVRRWHVIERNFSDIGYHYLVNNLDVPALEICRPVYLVGAHCLHENVGSIGVALAGNTAFNPRQFRILNQLLENLLETFNLHPSDIYPHNHFNQLKTCPNFDLCEYVSVKMS
jgi:N-acetyl-anhydromuramyl-L-alanine amidase AmpD